MAEYKPQRRWIGDIRQALTSLGYTNNDMTWCMELYNCPRFTEPDAQGNIILDYYIPIDSAK